MGVYSVLCTYRGRQAQPGGVGLLWLSLRQNSDGCRNGEGPLTPINFCESGFLCDELEMLHGLLSSCQWIS